VIQPHFGTVDQAVRFVQRLDGTRRENVAFQGDDVHTAGPGRVAFDQHVRRHVVQDALIPPMKL
jgi:hypothetical protein